MVSLPEPYYQDKQVTIYNADCRDILPHLGVADLVLTDPPYGIGEHGGKARTRGKSTPNHPNLGWDDERPSKELIDLILAAGHAQIIFGGNYFADMLPPSRCWLYWRKLMGGDFADGELAWTSLDAVVSEYTLPNKGHKGTRDKHPTKKPLPLMKWCIKKAGNPRIIYDPFMGSGTVLRAAKDMGLRAIGIDREETYCRSSAARMAATTKPQGFF